MCEPCDLLKDDDEVREIAEMCKIEDIDLKNREELCSDIREKVNKTIEFKKNEPVYTIAEMITVSPNTFYTATMNGMEMTTVFEEI